MLNKLKSVFSIISLVYCLIFGSIGIYGLLEEIRDHFRTKKYLNA